MRREERMLNGLYVFQLIEEETQPERVRELLLEKGFSARFIDDLGQAKHVFTHRVWNMRILHSELDAVPAGAQMVDLQEFEKLPFPTAVKIAVKEAKKLLGGKEE